MRNNIFFVHIPKTAGTSFRKSVESYFSVEKVLYDYSDKSSETSPLVANIIYQDCDYFSLKQNLVENDIRFLSGHISINKYVHVFGVRDVVTFLRDPIQRLISEYFHFVRYYGYKKSFKDFYRTGQFVNRQVKMLSSVPLESIGFIGLTECYDLSINQINHKYSTDFKVSQLNTGRYDMGEKYSVSDDDILEIKELNKDDLMLYSKVVEIFNERSKLFKKGLSYVHGTIQQCSSKSITGWAWWSDSESSVDVKIFVNDKFIATVSSVKLKPGLLRLSPPRLGYVGFHYDFSETLNANDVVRCEVVGTGQLIGKVTIS